MIVLVSNKIWHYYYFAIAAGTPGEQLKTQTKKKKKGTEKIIIAKHKNKRWEIKTINHENDGIEAKEGTLL